MIFCLGVSGNMDMVPDWFSSGDPKRKVDVRIITATNKNFREEIEKRNFREDLFYRLSVFSIEMIPLKPLLVRGDPMPETFWKM